MRARLGIAAALAAACACFLLGRMSVAQEDAGPPLPEDNAFCLVCHVNLEDEELVAQHIKGGVTCMHCHGVSYEHRDDESHNTPPDVLFGRAETGPFCGECHEGHARPEAVAEFMARWHGKVRENGRVIRGNAICTDCHGTHSRTR